MSSWGDNISELEGDIAEVIRGWQANRVGSAYGALDRWMGESMHRPADCRRAYEKRIITEAAAEAEAGGNPDEIGTRYALKLVPFWWPMMTLEDESATLEKDALEAGYVSTYSFDRDPDPIRVAQREAAANPQSESESLPPGSIPF
jgi:hypothetical protein